MADLGLASEDIEDIKSARSITKRKVLRKINNLKIFLRCDEVGNFGAAVAEINKDVIYEIMADLINNDYYAFLLLHDRYMEYRDKLDDTIAENAAIDLETNYVKGVASQ